MGGRNQQQQNVQRNIDSEYGRLNTNYDNLNTQFQGNLTGARGRASNLYDEILGNYRNFLDRDTSGFGVGSEARGGYSRYAHGGGLTPENISRLRGGGVYDEFARTGGLSEADKGTYRARGTASIPAFYGNLRNELATSRAAQGNYSPGYDAQMAKSVRDQAGAYQDAATNVEGDILDKVSAGRKWGATGMSDAERSIVDAIQRGEMFGISGLADADKFDSSNRLANAGLDLNAIQGEQGLYGQVPGEVQMWLQALLEGNSQRNSAVGANIGTNAGYNQPTGWWDRWGKSVFGGLAGVAGGLAAGGYFGKKPGTTGGTTGVPGQTNMFRAY